MQTHIGHPNFPLGMTVYGRGYSYGKFLSISAEHPVNPLGLRRQLFLPFSDN